MAIDLAATVRLRRSKDALYRVRQGEALVEAGSASALAAQPEGALVGVVAEALGLPPVDVTLTVTRRGVEASARARRW